MRIDYLIVLSLAISLHLDSNAQASRVETPESSLDRTVEDAPKVKWNYSESYSPSGKCRLQTVMPILTGLKNSVIENRINAELATLSNNAKRDYKRAVKEIRHCKAGATIDHKIDIIISRCRIQLFKNNIASFVCGEMNIGIAAYPIGFTRAVTANLQTGKIYRYEDLFRHNTDWVKKVRAAIWESNGSGNDNPVLKRELSLFGSSKSDFYLSSFCDYFGDNVDKYPFCLTIPTQHMSGMWRGKTIHVSFSKLKDILSDDPDLQFLIK